MLNLISSFFSNRNYQEPPEPITKAYFVPSDTFNIPTGAALEATNRLAEDGNILSLLHMADFYSTGAYRNEPEFSTISSPEHLIKAYSYLQTARKLTENKDEPAFLSQKMDDIKKIVQTGITDNAPGFIEALTKISSMDI